MCCSDSEIQPNKEIDLSKALSGCKPLSYEDADRILQNVLRACGYKESHLKPRNNAVSFESVS